MKNIRKRREAAVEDNRKKKNRGNQRGRAEARVERRKPKESTVRRHQTKLTVRRGG